MLEFENIIRVDRPVGEVFEFLSDFANIPKWNYFALEVRQFSESPIGIGTSYHQVRKTDEQDFRIIEFEPDHIVTVRTLTQSSPSFERRVTAVASTAFGTDLKETKSPDREEHLPSEIPDRRTKARDIVRTVSPSGGGYGDPLARGLAASWTTCWTASSPRRTPVSSTGWLSRMARWTPRPQSACERRCGGADPDAPRSSSSPSSDSRTCPHRKSQGGK
jgi:uncharacterized protein YndB with AHSA1/START domain